MATPWSAISRLPTSSGWSTVTARTACASASSRRAATRAPSIRTKAAGVSAETTFNEDLSAVADLENLLWPLCEKVARHARAEEIAGHVVTLKLRGTDFRIVTRRRTLRVATQTARTLFAESREMLAIEARGQPWRLIGVGISDIVPADAAGGDLFDGGESRALSSEKAIDALRGRFGAEAVIMGRSLKH